MSPSARKSASSAPRRSRLGLGGHVHRVARRLDAGEPGRRSCERSVSETSDPALAHLREVAGGSSRRSRPGCRRSGRAAGRPSSGAGAATASIASAAHASGPAAAGEGWTPSARAARRARSEQERPRRRRRGPSSRRPRRPRSSALVVGEEHRLCGIDEPAPGDGDRQQRHAGTSPPTRGEQRPRLHPRLLDLGLGLGVPDDPAADPEMDAAPGDGEGADRQGELEVAVRPRTCRARPSRRRGRPARARRSGRARRSSARRSPSRRGRSPPGSRPSVTPSRSRPSTVETRCVTPASSLLRHQLRPAHRARLADAREVVPLEVDDHHVLGGVLRVVDVLARGPRALDRHRHEPARRGARGRAPATRRRSPSRRRRTAAGGAGAAAPARRRARPDHLRTAPTGAGRGSPGRRRRARSPRGPPRSRRRSPRRPRCAPTRRAE